MTVEKIMILSTYKKINVERRVRYKRVLNNTEKKYKLNNKETLCTRYTYASKARLARNIADFRCVRYANKLLLLNRLLL